VGTAAWAVALPIYYLLHQTQGVFGLALASTTGILLNAGALYGILMHRTVGRAGIGGLAEYGKMALAAVLAGAAGMYALSVAGRFLSWETFPGALARFAAGALFIAVAYYAVAFLLGCRTVRAIRRKEDLLHPPSKPPEAPGTGPSG
jgi:peptidoglycan biosynthesis protein MviN/MurJ (putative lipid II flippase)